MESAVERKELKILHVLLVSIKGLFKSKRRRLVFWHILKITNSGKKKGVWEGANCLQVAGVVSFSPGKVMKEKREVGQVLLFVHPEQYQPLPKDWKVVKISTLTWIS